MDIITCFLLTFSCPCLVSTLLKSGVALRRGGRRAQLDLQCRSAGKSGSWYEIDRHWLFFKLKQFLFCQLACTLAGLTAEEWMISENSTHSIGHSNGDQDLAHNVLQVGLWF